MHELGIVFYIIKNVKQVAEENHVDHVSNVVMDIGEVSTIIPSYLTDCWRWAADKETLLKGCKLTINTIPAVTLCGEEMAVQLVTGFTYWQTAAILIKHLNLLVVEVVATIL